MFLKYIIKDNEAVPFATTNEQTRITASSDFHPISDFYILQCPFTSYISRNDSVLDKPTLPPAPPEMNDMHPEGFVTC